MGDTDIELAPEHRYYVVPIHEEGQLQDAPRRLLLVRRQSSAEKPGPHIWVIGSADVDQATESYASLHIIGGEDNTVNETSPLRPVGIVEAILTQEEATSPNIRIIRGEESTTLKFIPAYSNFAGVSEEDKAPNVYGAFEPGSRYEEYVEVGEFSINGKSHTLRPIDAKLAASKTFRLKQGYQYFAIQVQGDSMEPTIFTGEYALVRSQKQPDHDGQIVAVNIGHQTVSTPTTALIKRLSKIRNGVRLESDNSNYPPQDYTRDDTPVNVLGVVEAILSPASIKPPKTELETVSAPFALKPVDEDGLSTIKLIPPTTQQLTPEYLVTQLGPYLNAIVAIQHILDEMRGRKPRAVIIKSIKPGSVDVTLGDVIEALEVVQNNVVPWRKEHIKTMAQSDETEKVANIEKAKAEALEKRANADKTRRETAMLSIDDPRQKAEIERMQIENEQKRFELQRDKIRLTFEIMEKIGLDPHCLPDELKLAWINRLDPPLTFIFESELQIDSVVSHKLIESPKKNNNEPN
jgi:hypothetical protein